MQRNRIRVFFSMERHFAFCILHFALSCIAFSAASLFAQAAPQQVPPEKDNPAALGPEETEQQRLERLGVPEFPGHDPEPSKIFARFGKLYRIEKYEKEKSKPQYDSGPGMVRPFGWVNIQREIYQQDEKWLWVWEQVPPPVEPPAVDEPLARTGSTHYQILEPYQAKHFVNFRAEMVESPFRTTLAELEFVSASNGLPTEGSWRNSLDVADMNGDGHLDLVVPPQRGPNSAPSIFLGNGKGDWKAWPIDFPYPLAYGSVVASDFNQDGKMDLAVGSHLCCVSAVLGDGKGKFSDHSKELSDQFATRRIVVSDVNKDGYPDIVANSEGQMMAQRATGGDKGGKIMLYLNQRGKGWKEVPVAGREKDVGGDFLSAGDFNGDGRTDVVGSSVAHNATDLFYLGEKGGKWKSFGRDWLPYHTTYTALTSGKFTSKKRDDVILTYFREWPTFVDPLEVPPPDQRFVVGLERINWQDSKPVRTPIARWASKVGIWGVTPGDFNGDGRLDIAFVQGDPRRVVILAGDGEGHFRKVDLRGIKIRPNPVYDLKAADLNRDGREDLIVMYESGDKFSNKDGSIEVFLSPGGGQKAEGRRQKAAGGHER